MQKDVNKFGQLAEIYADFSEENKEKLLGSAKKLLKVQEEDEAALGKTEKNGPLEKGNLLAVVAG